MGDWRFMSSAQRRRMGAPSAHSLGAQDMTWNPSPQTLWDTRNKLGSFAQDLTNKPGGFGGGIQSLAAKPSPNSTFDLDAPTAGSNYEDASALHSMTDPHMQRLLAAEKESNATLGETGLGGATQAMMSMLMNRKS